MSSFSRRRGTNSGIAQKAPVRCATTANIALEDFQTIDGVTPTTNQHPRLRRVLVKSQTDASQNGIYEMQTGRWQRTADFNSTEDFSKGTRVNVTDGATQASQWAVSSTVNPDAFQWDVDSITFADALTTDYSDVLSDLDIGVTVQAWDADLDQFAALTPTDNSFLVGDGTDWTLESGATARATLGLTIGTHVQAWDAQLDLWAAETPADYYDTAAVDAAINAAANALLADLASTADGDGSDLVGLYDAGGYYTGTTVQEALQEIGADIAALDQAVILKGTWDASAGTFPGAGAAQAGWSYIVSVGGTVDSVVFVANDRIVAITDNASTTTFAANWHKLDYTDQVLSVAGKTGAVTLVAADISNASANGQSLITATNYAAMRALLDLEAGTDFYSITAADALLANKQPLDSDLTSWAGVTRASGYDTFAATPSSANLRSLLSDESGTGVAYFQGGDLGTPSAGVLTNCTGLPIVGHGQCSLAKVSSNLVLTPYNGNKLVINSVSESIPDAGVSLSASGLSTSTLYFIYAYMNAGTMTLEASTTGHSTQAGTGVEIKTGDATRSLVGMGYVVSGPNWADAAATRYVRSWFNRRVSKASANFSTGRTFTTTSFAEINSEIAIAALLWSGEVWDLTASQSVSHSVDGELCALGIALDGATTAPFHYLSQSHSGTYVIPWGLRGVATGLSEGRHTATLSGRVGSGTGTCSVDSTKIAELAGLVLQS